MIIEKRGAISEADKSAFIAPNASLAGHARIDRDPRVIYGASLDSESSIFEVEEYSINLENEVPDATAIAND